MQKSLMILASLILITGCSEKPGFEKGTEFYDFAKSLSLKYTKMHPDSVFILAKTNAFEYSSFDLITDMYETQGGEIFKMTHLSPKKLKERIKLVTEEFALRKIMLQRAAAANIVVSQSDVDSVFHIQFDEKLGNPEFQKYMHTYSLTQETIRKEIAKQMTMEAYITSTLSEQIAVSEEELRTDYEQGKTATVRHILLSTESKNEDEKKEIYQRLEGLLARAKKGENFADLARKYSEDQGSKDRGGLYQDFQRGRMVKPFEMAAFSLPAGAISDIVETPYGYHIIKVVERKLDPRPFEAARQEIYDRLRVLKRAEALPGLIEKIKQEEGLELLIANT